MSESTLTADRVMVVLPKTGDDIVALADDIETICKAYPDYDPDEFVEFVAWIASVPEILTLAYVDGKPAGFIRIDTPWVNGEVGRKCLEFHGGVLPEFEGTGLSEMVAPIAINMAFEKYGKKKMITKLKEADPKAVAALLRLGFEYQATDAFDGKRIYRLMRPSEND